MIQRNSTSTEDRPRRVHHGVEEGRDGTEGGSHYSDRVQGESLSIERPTWRGPFGNGGASSEN